MASRDELHRLIDELAERETDAALRFLPFLRQEGEAKASPVPGLDNAPEDDEPDTDEERRAGRGAREAFKRRETISLSSLKDQFNVG